MIRLLFRMPWWAYFLIAPLLLAGAVYAYFDDRSLEAAKDLARHHAPPAAVAVEKFDPAHNLGPGNEAVVIGQVDVARMMELTESKRGVERHHWLVAPIYPATAADTSAPAIAALVQDGAISDAELASLAVGQGPFGPVVKVDGLQRTDFSAKQAVEKALESKVTMAPSPLLIDPFEKGRQAGLAASDDGEIFAGVLAVIALLCAGYGFFRRSQQQTTNADMM